MTRNPSFVEEGRQCSRNCRDWTDRSITTSQLVTCYASACQLLEASVTQTFSSLLQLRKHFECNKLQSLSARKKNRRQHGRSKLYGRDEVRYTITAFFLANLHLRIITFSPSQKYRQGALEGLDQKNTKKFLRQSTPQHPRQFEE